MAVRTRFGFGTLLAVCGLVGAAISEAPAQIDLQEAFTGVPTARRQWEQRMLGQAVPRRAPVTAPAAYPLAPTRRAGFGAAAPMAGVRQVSVMDTELTPAEAAKAAAQDVYMEPFPGDTSAEQIPPGAIVQGYPGCANCQDDWGGCDVTYENQGACGSCGTMDYGCDGFGDCGSCGEEHVTGPLWWVGNPRYRGLFRDLSIFAGVHGFKGPLDQGRNGNFGFHEGVNFGAPLGDPWGFGYQLGAAAVHSNFTTTDSQDAGQYRNQVFLTAGIFRRQTVGFNSGVVFDYLNDSYYTDISLKQMRTETSWRFPTGGELGYWGAYGLDKDRVLDARLDPTDLFAFYYRRHFQRGGDGRVWAGFSGRGDGVFGADIRVPIGYGWALENSLNYLAPKHAQDELGQQSESWAVNIQFVWYLGQPAECALKSAYRPLFNVADNTNFMADFRKN